jgi:hypothetical protein
MCAVCFTAAQVVPLGALYARAKLVSLRESRGADVVTMPPPEEPPAPEPQPRDDVLASAR